ncbi:uncharacterized protein LOC126266256 [Aethina tumida]|uniref:uncharacterized protein LOC126266256 n=1 Tax=Aethina tumida TaxID=116153 RepID=UPI002147670B|nr:uncharacterized protein LOC126266256 [Aethina tumida]
MVKEHLGMIIGNILYKDFYPLEIDTVFNKIKETFSILLDNATWISNDYIEKAKSKVNNTVLAITGGKPVPEKLDKYYENLKTTPNNFLDNFINIIKLNTMMDFKNINRKNLRQEYENYKLNEPAFVLNQNILCIDYYY